MPHSTPTVYGLLSTLDAEILATTHRDRVSEVSNESHDVAVVLVHGFTLSNAHPQLRRVAEGLRRHAGVLSVDLRGHGDSTGMCTFGDREVFDVDAAIGEVRRLGYRNVVTIGWSMGGCAVLRHAALVNSFQHHGRDGCEAQDIGGAPARGGARVGGVGDDGLVHGLRLRHPPDAVVSVSSTSRWFVRDTAPMRRVHWMAESATGRALTRRLKGTRIDPAAWRPVPPSPVELVGRIAPTPLLIVHGDRDGFFSLEHPRALAAAAGPHAGLWILEGFGHAEAAAPPELLDRIGSELRPLLASATGTTAPAPPAPAAPVAVPAPAVPAPTPPLRPPSRA